MTKPKLIALKGLPASGKSTYAKDLAAQGWIRVNKDDLRDSLFGGHYKRKDEKVVVRVRDAIIEDALSHRKNVVVDDTNFNPIHIKNFQQLAKKHNADFSVNDSFLEVPIEECIKRDLLRPKSVGERVIRGMYHQYVKKPATSPEYDPNLPMAIICDIDGTLAHMDGKRGPHDLTKVSGDRADEGVAHLVDAVGFMGYAKVVIFSGRDEICRKETEEWLDRHDIEYDEFYMRPSDRVDSKGNKVPDTVIKRELFEQHIRNKYNVLFVVDDRPSVCRMWRDELGLRVMQVGDPYYEF